MQSIKYFSPASFASKIHSLYNILQVAVSTYVNNARNFEGQGVPPKIEELLISIWQTTVTCVDRKLFDEDDYVVQVRFAILSFCQFVTVARFRGQQQGTLSSKDPKLDKSKTETKNRIL